MITPEEFLKVELENFNLGFGNPDFINLAIQTVKQIESLPVKTILDYGAGTGVYVDQAYKAGYDAKAFEIWKAHRDYVLEHAPYIEFVPEPITTDLLMFIETAEHMTDEELDNLFKAISPTYVLFSSTSQTTDWDLEWGHINIKSQEAWIEKFKSWGYSLEKDLPFPTPWSKLFKKI